MTITADQQAAVTKFAMSFVELTESLGVPVPEVTGVAKQTTKKRAARKKRYEPVDASTPQAVREERQRLILAEIDAAGGSVTRQEWLEIAKRYGYDSLRLGGFFAKKNGTGMLAMSMDRKMVQLTPHGRARV